MKNAVLGLSLAASLSPAMAAETVGGKVACLTEQWFEDFVKFVAADDMGSVQAYLDSQKCMRMNDGLPVTVLEPAGLVSGHWLVAFRGTKFYVQRDGIRNY